MKRVGIISEHASPMAHLGSIDAGGQNVYVGQLASHLVSLGYAVDVLTRRDAPEQPGQMLHPDGFQVVHVPAGPPAPIPKESLLPYIDDFAALVLERAVDYSVLHANHFMSGVVATKVRRVTGAPFVITFHALGRVRRPLLGTADAFPIERDAIEAQLVRDADGIIAECPQEFADLVRLYDADPNLVTVIPAGFDPREMSPVSREAARRAVGLPADDHQVILQLGRLVPRKGMDTAVRALRVLRQDFGISPQLVIVGGDGPVLDEVRTPEIGRLRRIAEEEGVASQLAFTGSCDRQMLRYYYGAADVFVTTPWYEPFGLTVIEAMACGIPVIGSRVGGIASTVRDRCTGYLIPPGDATALATRLASLLGNQGLRERLGRAAVVRAHTHFTWEIVSKRIASLYEEVLESRGT